MSKIAEEAAWKWATENKLDPYSMGRAYGEGYEQAEKDALERAIEWWRPRLCGFLKEELTEGVLEEFRKAMED